MKTIIIDIGISGCFLTRRWEEPENFMRLTKELGYSYHEFCADTLDPFFSGDKTYQLETARRIREAAEHYGVTICNFCTGVATYRFHGFSHSNASVRQSMLEWISRAMDISLAMGAERIGGHLDAIPVEVLEDDERYRIAIERLYGQLREMARLAKEKGIVTISYEQMYVPSLVPWTIAEAVEFLIAVNRESEGVPIYLTVDVGHQASQEYGASWPDTDYREWLKHFGAVSEMVHIQQTTPAESLHWPFTSEYNREGHVDVGEIVESILYSHEHFSQQPFAQYLQPVERNILVLEVIPPTVKSETRLLRELEESCEYLRRWIPEGGLRIEIQ